MALTSTTQQQWESFLRAAGIPDAQNTEYTAKLIANRVSTWNITDFERQDFHDLEITAIGDIKNILRHAKATSTTTATDIVPTAPAIKAPAAVLPRIDADMTKPQFRKFRIDWSMFKRSTRLQDDQVHSYLYNCCDPHVQSALVNTNSAFTQLSEDALLDVLEGLVTKQSNPTVHRLHFASIYQQEKETIKNYILRLRAASPDCAFTCHSCHTDQQEQHIMDQFIRGISNELLQTDILAKASSLNTLEAVVKHSEGFEAAQRDQSELQANPEVLSLRSSRMKKSNVPKHRNNQNKVPQNCSGCGSPDHGQPGGNDRAQKCPAWGKRCDYCGIPNHFADVCKRKERQQLPAEVKGIHQEPTTEDAIEVAQVASTSNTPVVSPKGELLTEISLKLDRHKNIAPVEEFTFPDSGSNICVGGPQHLEKFNLDITDLIPPGKVNQFITSSGERAELLGWLPACFSISINTTSLHHFTSVATYIYMSEFAGSQHIDKNPSSPHAQKNYLSLPLRKTSPN